MSANNFEAIVLQANVHISNINRLLKDMKFEVSANFICSDNKDIIITTNKAVAFSDLSISRKICQRVEQY